MQKNSKTHQTQNELRHLNPDSPAILHHFETVDYQRVYFFRTPLFRDGRCFLVGKHLRHGAPLQGIHSHGFKTLQIA
jgi:hypothetical protein